jgi:hypothetical protein
VILTTVTYKTGPDTRSQYAKDMDFEAKHDADRCVNALKKRFPDYNFTITRKGVAQYEIEGGTDAAWLHLSAFAEGFMASAHLWER